MKSILELSTADKVFHKYKNMPYVSGPYMWKSEYYPVYHPYKAVRLIRKSTDRWEAIELAPSYVCNHKYTERYK